MISQLKVDLIPKLIGQLICFGYFLHVIRGCSYTQALAEVVSTGAAIKCVYCNIFFMWISFLPFASDRNIPNYMVTVFLYIIGCKNHAIPFLLATLGCIHLVNTYTYK